jgi:hypothetical protein
VLVAALAGVLAVELQEREFAAAALLVLWFAAVVLVIALRRAQEPGQPDNAHRSRRLAAGARACHLLREHLNEEQREQFERAGSFVVVAQSGRRYRIRSANTSNVRDETDGASYCVQFRSDPQCLRIPLEDLMLAQKLLLECDEPQFLRIANKSSVPDRRGW